MVFGGQGGPDGGPVGPHRVQVDRLGYGGRVFQREQPVDHPGQHALARRKPDARPRTLRAAGIELDPVRRTVVRDGRQRDLSVKEFAVLEALLRTSPGFLSAETLLEQVWDENADRFTNTVAVTVGRLRRKLGDPPVIATTPGVGYHIA